MVFGCVKTGIFGVKWLLYGNFCPCTLIFLEVSAKNKALFFFKSLREQNITSPLTGVSDTYGSYGSYGSSLGILNFFDDVFPNDAERLVAINDLLERNTFAVRDSDRELALGVSSAYHSWRVRTVLSGAYWFPSNRQATFLQVKSPSFSTSSTSREPGSATLDFTIG